MSKISKIKLGKIARFQQGLQVDVDRQFFLKKENYVRFLRIVDYTNNDEIPRYIENTKNSPSYVSKNDVVMIRYGSQTAGKVVIGQEGIIANNMFRIIPFIKGVENRYLYFFLKNQVIYNFLMNGQSSSTMPAITFEMMKDVDIYLPSIQDQQKIAFVLSAFENKIELNNKINVELEQVAKTLYDYWFVQFDFPDKKGKPYKSSGGKMVFSEELKREIPEGWEVGTIGDKLKTFLGGTPSRKIKEYWDNGNVNWLSSGEIAEFPISRSVEKISDKGLKNSAAKLLKPGSIMISITGNIRVSILNIMASANQSVVGIEENDEFKKSYLYFFILNHIPRYESLMAGAVQKHINKDVIDSTLLLIPHKEITEKFYNFAQPIFDKILIISKENQKLAELRDWLLPMLMNGQVKVEN